MRKLRIISIVTLFILFIFITKDYVLKACIKHYIGKELNGRCKIDKAQVLFNGINIEGFKLSSQSLEFTLGQGNVEVGFPEILKPRIYRVTLRDARLTIKNLESTKDMIADKFTGLNAKPQPEISREITPLRLDLKNIFFRLENKGGLNIDINFSFLADIVGGGIPLVENIEVFDANVVSDNFAISRLKIAKTQDQYILKIPNVKIKDKEIEDVVIPFIIEGQTIVLKGAENPLFGPASLFEGVIELKDYKNLCLNLGLSNASFQKLITIMGGEESVDFGGSFEGEVNFCLQDFKLADIKGDFYNNSGGFINIKKETTLNFLKRYLNESSYNTLIESLKNYRYNEAVVKIGKDKGALIFHMDCDSEEGGRRNISVNFHNILGGGR